MQGMQDTCEFSRGNGTGVAEALGNWGFSNGVASSGRELDRLKCLFGKMDSLRRSETPTCVRYDRGNDPEAWVAKPSPEECKPAWTFPAKRPLITYSSTATVIVTSSLLDAGSDLAFPMPERSYHVQRRSKNWYKRELAPDRCPRPRCPRCPRC
ncbi:uncharacterized protein LOC105699810 [Orussus abietinus]|uniref:uncharacterized protein LOC105699810 n=1 Tax=Orussus abietinus TaxID=222816 RepID=UPI0006269C2F|nr:uncharacterized protein LOC105699810 [Orussus abietinus]